MSILFTQILGSRVPIIFYYYYFFFLEFYNLRFLLTVTFYLKSSTIQINRLTILF
jgi:hypothetical protein